MQTSISVQVPQRLKNFLANPSSRIDSIMKEADREALELLKKDISSAAPKKSGKLSKSIDIDLSEKKVFSNLIYVRAIELGHFAEPVRTPKRMFLHFTDKGKEVFLKYVRTRKQPFFFPTLSKDKVKIIDIYDKAFNKLP